MIISHKHRTKRFLVILTAVCMLVTALPVHAAKAPVLNLPAGLKRIEEQAFYGDTGLDTVVVQEGTETIGSEAFARSSVKTVTLPGSLYSIADNAFAECENLTVNAQEGTYAYAWAVKNGYIKIEEGAEGAETKVVVPETLRAGMDLTVQLFGPSDTIHHSVYVVNVATGEYQYRDLTKGTAAATFNGYFFESGSTYRLTVYTVTRQYQTLTPVRKIIQVTGQKPTAPALKLPDTMMINQDDWYEMGVDGNIRAVCEYYNADGELIQTYVSEYYNAVYLSTWFFSEYANGERIQIKYLVSQNGIWSEWGKHTITIVPPFNPYTINVIDCPDTIEDGQDFGISFEYEGYVEYCECSIKQEGTDDYIVDGECQLWRDSGFGTAYISTLNMQPGTYTLYLYFIDENWDRICVYQKKLNVTEGNRGKAPAVSVNKDEAYLDSYATFTITTLGADKVATREEYPWGDYYTNIRGVWSGNITEWNMGFDKQGTYSFSFAVRRNGRWSAWSEPIEVLAKERPKLAAPNIQMNTPAHAGEDWTFTFDEVDNATKYKASLRPGYDDDNMYTLAATPTDLNEIPGYLLSSGSYVIEVTASAEDYESGSRKKLFTVTGNRPNSPDVTDNGPIYTDRDAVFSINTQEADALQVNYRLTHPATIRNGISISVPITGDITKWYYPTYNYYKGYTLNVSFSVRINGIWSDWETRSYFIEGPAPATPTDLPATPTDL